MTSDPTPEEYGGDPCGDDVAGVRGLPVGVVLLREIASDECVADGVDVRCLGWAADEIERLERFVDAIEDDLGTDYVQMTLEALDDQ